MTIIIRKDSRLLFLLLLLYSCNSSLYSTQWSSWEKATDFPGIHYRILCEGPAFEGSAFYRWRVEIYNSYPESASIELHLLDELSGKVLSETKLIAIAADDLKQVTFLNVPQVCTTLSLIEITDIQFLD